jgi:undecaprenyl pyrophosphate phosphatase UppP
MKGSTIFWIAVAVSTYLYAWYALVSNWTELESEEAAKFAFLLAVPFMLYLYYDFLTSLGEVGSFDKVIGPFTFIARLLPRFNKFLDKHIGL